MFNKRRNGLSFKTEKKTLKPGRILVLVKWVAGIVICLALSYFAVFFFGFRTLIIGNAMSPTLEASDSVLVNRLAYIISEPSRMQVVAFLPKSNSRSNYYIRRIVAIPGDTILISDGFCYVNGEVIELPGKGDEITVAGLASEEITLGEDEYFVIGDAPNSSEDSRHSGIGMVSKDEMLGVVWFVISPLDRIDTVK